MSNDWNVYLKVDGRTVTIPSSVVALAIGVPHEDLITELKKHGGDLSKLPKKWQQQARRRAAETSAKLNDGSVMSALRNYAEEGQR